jgi:hypothetical protein
VRVLTTNSTQGACEEDLDQQKRLTEAIELSGALSNPFVRDKALLIRLNECHRFSSRRQLRRHFACDRDLPGRDGARYSRPSHVCSSARSNGCGPARFTSQRASYTAGHSGGRPSRMRFLPTRAAATVGSAGSGAASTSSRARCPLRLIAKRRQPQRTTLGRVPLALLQCLTRSGAVQAVRRRRRRLRRRRPPS